MRNGPRFSGSGPDFRIPVRVWAVQVPFLAVQAPFLTASRFCTFNPFSLALRPQADSGSYRPFAIVYISIVRRKQAEKALALSAFFLAFGCGSSCSATPVP